MFSQLADLYESMVTSWRLQTDGATRAAIEAWCIKELAPWAREGSIRVEPGALQELNATRAWTFLYEVGPAGAKLVAKPAAVDTGGDPAHHRAAYYEGFLDRVARRARLPAPVVIAIDLNDSPVGAPGVPVFAFQKSTGSSTILIPDIDFLLQHNNSLPSWLTFDRRPWSRKQSSAVFAGSTTGGLITAQVVRDLSLPRLRSGVFFRDKPDVVFRLPQLVDCDAPETEAMLRAMGFGVDAQPWQLQFRHRLIISMDGNGATCSRVAITLRSRSVLLKYASDRQLFYFHGLEPWRHYVPIDEDADVLRTLALVRAEPQVLRDINTAGRRFAHTFLTRRSIEHYMAVLLRRYAGLLAG
jgi:hypothetical protein